MSRIETKSQTKLISVWISLTELIYSSFVHTVVRFHTPLCPCLFDAVL